MLVFSLLWSFFLSFCTKTNGLSQSNKTENLLIKIILKKFSHRVGCPASPLARYRVGLGQQNGSPVLIKPDPIWPDYTLGPVSARPGPINPPELPTLAMFNGMDSLCHYISYNPPNIGVGVTELVSICSMEMWVESEQERENAD